MNSGAVSIIYDGDGNRVAKTAAGVTTQYLVDDLNPTGYPQVVDELQGGAVQREYTYGLQRISENQPVSGAWTPSFYGYDGGGTVRQLTNASGTVTDTYNYDAFGNKLNSTGSTPNNYLYRGEQYDPDLGFYYLRARYYNPQSGRFVAKDPYPGHIDIPATLHRYLYTGANPISCRDPSGMDAELEAGEIETEISASTEAEEGLENVRNDVDCYLETTADALDALSSGNVDATSLISIALNFKQCNSKAKRAPCGNCFAAGTPVHERSGEVPIEDVKEGDEVLAKDASTGKEEYKRVIALILPHQDHLIDLRIEGESNPLRPSLSHPFWVEHGDQQAGWRRAEQIGIGDRVETIQGQWRRVVAVAPESGTATVYNFTVANDHDYFVGETGFLVHNQNCGCGPPFSSKAPWLTQPGVRVLEGQYWNDFRWEPWKAYYDEWGQQIGRTDFNAGNPAEGIPDTHYHSYEWGPGKIHAPVEEHVPGEWPGATKEPWCNY